MKKTVRRYIVLAQYSFARFILKQVFNKVVKHNELLLADISNWAAHGLLALVSVLVEEDMLSDWDNDAVLTFLSNGGSVDGVTGENTLTEDSVASSVSQRLVKDLQTLSGF